MKKIIDKTEKKLKNLKPYKKGQSGNLRGRPKGVKNFSTIFQEAIKKIAREKSIKECDVEVDLVIKAIAEARGGNYQYYKDIFDRNYGKPKEKIELEGGESVININITGGEADKAKKRIKTKNEKKN